MYRPHAALLACLAVTGAAPAAADSGNDQVLANDDLTPVQDPSTSTDDHDLLYGRFGCGNIVEGSHPVAGVLDADHVVVVGVALDAELLGVGADQQALQGRLLRVAALFFVEGQALAGGVDPVDQAEEVFDGHAGAATKHGVDIGQAGGRAGHRRDGSTGPGLGAGRAG